MSLKCQRGNHGKCFLHVATAIRHVMAPATTSFPYAVDKRQPQGLCSRHFHCGSSIFPLNVRHVVRPAISVCNYSQSTAMQGTQRPKPNGFLLLQLFDCLQHLVGLTLEHANLLFCFLIMCKNDNNKFRLPNSFSSL